MASPISFGTVPVEVQLRLPGLDFVQSLSDGRLPMNTIADTLDYRITDVKVGAVTVCGEPKEGHLNPAGTVHGGWISTLLDSCMGLAVRTQVPAGVLSTTLELKVTFLRPLLPTGLPVTAVGKVLSVGRRVGVAEGHLFDSAGKLVAHGVTTCLNLAEQSS